MREWGLAILEYMVAIELGVECINDLKGKIKSHIYIFLNILQMPCNNFKQTH